jgi:hypothetical protein
MYESRISLNLWSLTFLLEAVIPISFYSAAEFCPAAEIWDDWGLD